MTQRNSLSPSLATLQATMTAAIHQRSDESTAQPLLVGDASTISDRLAIYRGNMVANLGSALQAAYPVCQQLVGNEFFAALAREYWRQTPSTDGDLGEYGAIFPDFVAQFEHTQSLPYLPDVAHLEWAAHLAYRAANHQPYDLQKLAALPLDALGTCRATLQAGLHLLAPTYPAYEIWQAHQAEEVEFNIDWDAEPALIIVYRFGLTVRIEALPRPSYSFLHTWQQQPLETALSEALKVDPRFDLGATLAEWIGKEVITDIQ